MKREIITGLQYLTIGFIAFLSVNKWFGNNSLNIQMIVWATIALLLGILRLGILLLMELRKRSGPSRISRRIW